MAKNARIRDESERRGAEDDPSMSTAIDTSSLLSWIYTSSSYWIDYFDERKTMEIGIARVDASNPMLFHKGGGLRIMQDIAPEMWNFRHNFAQDGEMSLRRQ
jgi:hypothetical protein